MSETVFLRYGCRVAVCLCVLVLLACSSCRTTDVSGRRKDVIQETKAIVAEMAEEDRRWCENGEKGRDCREVMMKFQKLMGDKELLLDAVLDRFSAPDAGSGELSVMACLLSCLFPEEAAIRKTARLFDLPGREARFHAYEAVGLMLLENERRYGTTPERDRLRRDMLDVLRRKAATEDDDRVMLALQACVLVSELEDGGKKASDVVASSRETADLAPFGSISEHSL